MKVLLINSRYYIRGGPERYLFNLSALLEERGHQVIPFSTRHRRNEPSPYEHYFVSGVGGPGDETFADVRLTPRNVARLLARSLYSYEVKRALIRLITETRPDIAMMINYKKKLSPSVIDACAKREIPVIVRLTDFTSVCPQGAFLRNNRLCELCLHSRNKIHSVRHRCIKHSFAASAVNFAAELLHEVMQIDSRVSLFVTPSQFALAKFVEGGLEPDRIALLPQFIAADDAEPQPRRGSYILYFGRVAPDKGIQNLVRAFAEMQRTGAAPGATLRIVGPDHDGESRRIADLIARERVANVSLSGPLPERELEEAVRGALLTVVPSLWYDVIPNSILESYKWSKPVVTNRIGSFPEAVQHGKTGLLCDTGDIPAFSAAMASLIAAPERCQAMGREGRRWIREHASPEAHYRTLLALFERIRAASALVRP